VISTVPPPHQTPATLPDLMFCVLAMAREPERNPTRPCVRREFTATSEQGTFLNRISAGCLGSVLASIDERGLRRRPHTVRREERGRCSSDQSTGLSVHWALCSEHTGFDRPVCSQNLSLLLRVSPDNRTPSNGFDICKPLMSCAQAP
jgi:hypothetical protein